MNYLFIDGSENDIYAQAGSSGNFFQQTFATNRNLAAKITEICTQILEQASFKSEQTDLFAVCTGPGSLTGLRVANSFMRSLAFLNQRPLIGVDLFTWSAVTLQASGQKGKICLMVPTLIDKAFALEVDLDCDLTCFIPEPQLIEDRLHHSQLATFGIRWQTEAITRVEPEAAVLHKLIGRQEDASAEFSQLLKVLPLYIIPSQAERKLEEKIC